MRRHKYLGIAVALFLFVGLQVTVFGQTADDGKLATVNGGGSIIRWDVVAQNAGGTLTITTPDNRSFRRSFRAGGSPEISLSDKQLEGLPDGVYSYELRLTPALTPGQKEALLKARGNDDDSEAERGARRRPTIPSMIQSGSFSIVDGSIVVAGAAESQRTGKTSQPSQPRNLLSANTVSRLFNHRVTLGAMPDVVTADDEIIQGSLCVGLDCVNGEVFNFDTIRLKENNTRISFNDTSTSAGFPTNDWTIRANDSASGGGNFLGFVDRGTSNSGDESGTIVFRVDAGASANALRVGSNSKVGLRTATPVLDIHMNTSDTPAVRFEQNNTGGFTAQTWDIGANEANFFVRDVTSGSRLPFRIRPGAPTSSIDISATGNVGIGTASPDNTLHVFKGSAGTVTANGSAPLVVENSSTAYLNFLTPDANESGILFGNVTNAAAGGIIYNSTTTNGLQFRVNGNSTKMIINSTGQVGIGTTAPDQLLSVNGDASKTGGNTWLAFSDERLKNVKGNFNSGLKAVMQLQPIRYEYSKNNALGLKSDGEHIGFGAQAVQKILPEAVVQNSNGYLMVNGDPIMWTMLNAIKEQQKEIEALRSEVRKLRATRHARRK
ncbi:MAG TPA: tail fiber domain-containing protein [Pyrinomonadaceae bacterium]|nr:tail fiber domain-containing protein [Pyrinomonadaceae bacterium]